MSESRSSTPSVLEQTIRTHCLIDTSLPARPSSTPSPCDPSHITSPPVASSLPVQMVALDSRLMTFRTLD
jgi:hypothetical protein